MKALSKSGKMTRWASLRLLLGAAALVGCLGVSTGCRSQPPPDAEHATSAATPNMTSAPVAALASSSAALAAAPKRHPHALDTAAFKQLVEQLSEPDAEFFSDNFISNETSYLQPARLLAKRPQGGAYIGVGPEQNFTYIALTKPDRAYLVDIRRDNLVLHLLYKAAFEEAVSRPHFLALLTGRSFDTAAPQLNDPSMQELFASVEGQAATQASYAQAHALLRKRVVSYGFPLAGKDGRSFDRAHQAFFKGGLELRFTLKENSLRRYPTLRSLLAHKSPEGEQLGFMASEASFRYLRTMHRENRIVPVVGDFAGDGALPALAKHLSKSKLVTRSFYVSNVEQYLMQNGVWWKWQRNIAALPTDAESIFIRGYLDQGKRHPQQLEGHRTATTLHPMDAFKRRSKPYQSMWALATDSTLNGQAVASGKR